VLPWLAIGPLLGLAALRPLVRPPPEPRHTAVRS